MAIPDTSTASGRLAARIALVLIVVLTEILVLAALGFGGPLFGILVVLGAGLLVLSVVSLPAAWFTIVALVPFSQETMIPGTGSALQIPTEPMVFLAEIVWIFSLLQQWRFRWPSKSIALPTVAFLLLAFASAFYSSYPSASVKAALNQTWYVLFGLFMGATLLETERDLRRTAVAFALPGGAITVYYLQNVVRTGLSIDAVNRGAMPFFGEHGTFAAYLCFVFPMALLCAIWAGRLCLRVFYVAVAATIGAGILFSLTRAAWVGFVAMAMVGFLLSGRFRRGKLVIASVALVVILVSAAGALTSRSTLSRHAQSIFNTTTNVSNLERISRWAAAIDMFRAYPLGGVGFGTYKYHYSQFRHTRLSTTESRLVAGAHNIYLSVLSELGLAGALMGVTFIVGLLCLISRTLALSRRAGRRGRTIEWTTIALAAGLSSYAAHGLFNYYPSWDKVNVPIWTFLGALAVCYRLAHSAAAAGEKTSHAS